MNSDKTEWLTLEDLADLLRVSVSTVYAWNHKRSGPPPYRIGRHVRYRRSEVEDWIDRHRLPTAADAGGARGRSRVA